MRCRAPGGFLLFRIGGDTRHHINAPADVSHVRRVIGAARQLVPLSGLGVVDIVGAWKNVEGADIANDRGIVGFRIGAYIPPPGQHRSGSGQELLEAGGVGIGIELIGGFMGQSVDHILNRPDPSRVVDARLHGVNVEQPGLIVRVLGVGGGAAAQEIETEAAPALGRIEIAVEILAIQFLAFQKLGDRLYLLPGFRNGPFALAALRLPGRGELRVRENIGAVIEGVAIAVDRNAIGLAVPRADRRLQIADIVIHLDLGLDPVGHLGGEPLATDIALEGSAHLDQIEVNRAGGNRLLQARIVICLGQIDPGYLGAGVGFPRLQKAAKQNIVQVLVV